MKGEDHIVLAERLVTVDEPSDEFCNRALVGRSERGHKRALRIGFGAMKVGEYSPAPLDVAVRDATLLKSQAA